MSNQIYLSSEREQRLKNGPIGAFTDELATVLLERGYSKRDLVARFAVTEELNSWLIREKIKLLDFDKHRIDPFNIDVDAVILAIHKQLGEITA